MGTKFETILAECIARLDAGQRIDQVLAQHPREADELLPDLELWAQLVDNRLEDASPWAVARGAARLSLAIHERRPSGMIMPSPARGSMGTAGAAVVVAALVFVSLFASGIIGGGTGSSNTEAQSPVVKACLDQVLGGLDGTPGFTLSDLIALRDAYRTQDTDPRFDPNGDGTVDLQDVLIYRQELTQCIFNDR